MIKLLLLGMLKAWWLLPIPIMLIAGVINENISREKLKNGK